MQAVKQCAKHTGVLVAVYQVLLNCWLISKALEDILELVVIHLASAIAECGISIHDAFPSEYLVFTQEKHKMPPTYCNDCVILFPMQCSTYWLHS